MIGIFEFNEFGKRKKHLLNLDACGFFKGDPCGNHPFIVFTRAVEIPSLGDMDSEKKGVPFPGLVTVLGVNKLHPGRRGLCRQAQEEERNKIQEKDSPREGKKS